MHGEGDSTGQELVLPFVPLAKPSEVSAAWEVLCSALWGWRRCRFRSGLTPTGAARWSGGTSCKIQRTGLWWVHQIQVTSASGRPPLVALRVQMAYSQAGHGLSASGLSLCMGHCGP